MPYRTSKYINFDTGAVYTAPMDLIAAKQTPLSLDDKIDIFECRVEVWQLGVATTMLYAIENSNSTTHVWSHAAYGMLSCSVSYFEMIGKSLNPKSHAYKSSAIDFNTGFCDVYPAFACGISGRTDADLPKVQQFRDRLRNGLYHLAYTKDQLWIHNDMTLTMDDFHITTHSPPEYLVNPHRMIRSLVDHFPLLIQRLRDPANNHLRGGFASFFDNYHK